VYATPLEHLRQALMLINGTVTRGLPPEHQETRDLVSALKHAISITHVEFALSEEPIRTIHHFSCTGGTMIAKCTASMPNVTLLNEVDFHSRILDASTSGPALFTPTDIVSLMKQARMNATDGLISDIFLSDVSLVHKHEYLRGRELVLRDHTHGHFLTGETIADRPTMKEQLCESFPVLSIVTVRNPIDSWLSMIEQGWHSQFSPSTFPEYCRRYNQFLDRYQDDRIIRYEDFVDDPTREMRTICATLDLGFFEQFERVFQGVNLSGDSGRRSGEIKVRPRRENPDFDLDSAVTDPEFKILAERLGYAE